MTMTIEREVKKIVCALFDVDDPKSDDRLVIDLLGDELVFVELVLALEDEFDINIYDADAEKMQAGTVGDVIAYIEGRLAARAVFQPKAK